MEYEYRMSFVAHSKINEEKENNYLNEIPTNMKPLERHGHKTWKAKIYYFKISYKNQNTIEDVKEEYNQN